MNRSEYKLGKAEPKRDERNLKLRRYLPAGITPAPPAMNWLGPQMEWGMMANDVRGDCVWASFGHTLQVWSKQLDSKNEVTVPDATILQGYKDCCGWVETDPATDQGCILLDALNFWRKTPIDGHQLEAYVQLDTQDIEHVKKSIEWFGGVVIGLALPVSAQTQTVWEVTGDPLNEQSNSAPGSWGGHAIVVAAYNDTTEMFTGISWGEPLHLSYEFWKMYCDESYALLGDLWAKPGDLLYETLAADLELVTAV